MLASGSGVSSLPFTYSSCRKMGISFGLDKSFYNKLDWSLDLLKDPLFFLFLESHLGGGCKGKETWSLRYTFRGRGSSPPVLLLKLWCLLWLPAPSPSPVNLLAKRWLCGVMSSGQRRLLMLFLPASMLKGRQCFSKLKSISSFSSMRRRDGAPTIPSGFVPGDGGCVLKLLMLFGPDCNFRSMYRVLSACFWDLLCFLVFLWVPL